jgi:hypothetical protein
MLRISNADKLFNGRKRIEKYRGNSEICNYIMEHSSTLGVETTAQVPLNPTQSPQIKLQINETIDTCKPKQSEAQTSPQMVYNSHKKGFGPSSPLSAPLPPFYFQGLEVAPPCPR